MPLPWSLRRLALLLAIFFFATPAIAELGYLEYSLGAAYIPNQNLTGSGLSGSVRSDVGFAVGAAVGTTILDMGAPSLRGEIAVDYRSANTNSLNVVSGFISESDGEIKLFSAMANAYMDFDLDVPATPFIGFGVGYGQFEIDAETRTGEFKIAEKEAVFTWNVMAGVTLPYSNVVDFTASYRYVATTDSEVTVRALPFGATTATSTRIDAQFDAHELRAGIRVKF